jgi:hypothetical protein
MPGTKGWDAASFGEQQIDELPHLDMVVYHPMYVIKISALLMKVFVVHPFLHIAGHISMM